MGVVAVAEAVAAVAEAVAAAGVAVEVEAEAEVAAGGGGGGIWHSALSTVLVSPDPVEAGHDHERVVADGRAGRERSRRVQRRPGLPEVL